MGVVSILQVVRGINYCGCGQQAITIVGVVRLSVYTLLVLLEQVQLSQQVQGSWLWYKGCGCGRHRREKVHIPYYPMQVPMGTFNLSLNSWYMSPTWLPVCKLSLLGAVNMNMAIQSQMSCVGVVEISLVPLPPHTGEGEMAVREQESQALRRDQQATRRL